MTNVDSSFRCWLNWDLRQGQLDENERNSRVVFKQSRQQRFDCWTTATPDDEAPPVAQHNVSLSAFLAPLYRA